MKSKELSNRVAPTIAIRVENFLIQYKEKTFLDAIANFIFGKNKRAELNHEVVSVMNYIFKHTDLCVDLIIDQENYSKELEYYILESSLPYNRILLVEKPVKVSILLNVNDIDYYVDNDFERMAIIGHRRCITLEQLYEVVKGGYKFV